MTAYRCGLDFGTSNSVICVLMEGQAPAPVIISEPTVLFFPERKTSETFVYYVGQEAVAAYLASGMRGRFIQSLKSVLPDPDFDMTMIYGVPYTPVELVELIVAHLKRKMEAKLGFSLDTVVMGRPVIFSENPEEDQLAQQRIYYAARNCGFKQISFQLEPIGAAFTYEVQLSHPQTVLVVDLGGGTTDFTVMKLDPTQAGKADRSQDILVTGGVHIGGDDFDARLMWYRLVAQFGYGSQYQEWGRFYDFPVHFFTTLCTWYDIAKLKDNPFKEHLRIILRTSTNKPAVEKLKILIEQDLGFGLFKAIEKAKMSFSQKETSIIQFSTDSLTVETPVTRDEFNQDIAEDLQEIENALTQTLQKAGLTPQDIDSVMMTGGSSLVTRIQQMIVQIFGDEKMMSHTDRFTSVAMGLALSDLPH